MCMCKYPFNLNLQYKHLKQSFYIKTYMFCDIFYYFGKKVICYSFYHVLYTCSDTFSNLLYYIHVVAGQ